MVVASTASKLDTQNCFDKSTPAEKYVPVSKLFRLKKTCGKPKFTRTLPDLFLIISSCFLLLLFLLFFGTCAASCRTEIAGKPAKSIFCCRASFEA